MIPVLPPQPAKNMINSLTGLRFYAALLVFISHFYIYNYLFGISEGAVHEFLVEIGWLGVSLFFVLSGFVLFINYLSPGKAPIQLGQFYIARLARIYPVFFLTVLLAAPIEFLTRDKGEFFTNLSLHLSMLHTFSGTAYNAMNVPGWSISVEWIFYLLFPLFAGLFTISLRRNVLLAFLGYGLYMTVMLVFFKDSHFAHAPFALNRLAEFLTGMVLGHLYCHVDHYPTIQRVIRQRAFPAFAVVALLLAFLMMLLQPVVLQGSPIVHQVFYLYYLFPSAVIVFGLALLERIQKPLAYLSHPWVVLGGEISYSFYLIHHLVIRYFKHILAKGFGLDILQFPPIVMIPIALGILIVSLWAAYILYNRVEKPWRKRFLQLFAKKPHYTAQVKLRLSQDEAIKSPV